MRRNLLAFFAVAILVVLFNPSAWGQNQKPPIRITADLSDAPRKLFHAEMDLPVTTGPLALTTPKWIPAQHMPYGPAGTRCGLMSPAQHRDVLALTVLRAAIRDTKGKSEPIHLIVQLDNVVSTVGIHYHDGERYPILERVEGTPAYLDDITKPLVLSKMEQPE
jgi:hypothetical protein